MRNKLIIITCLCVGLVQSITSAQNEIALIMKSSGLVSVSYKGESKHALVSKGYLMLSDAIIQTGANGFAVIKYIRSRSVVTVRPRSEVIITGSKQGKIFNESLEMRLGEALLEIYKPHRHTFELYSSAGMISFEESQSLVMLSKDGNETAVYNLSGNARIADNNFSAWKDISSESTAFATQYGFVQVNKLSQKAVSRLQKIFESTRRLKPGPSMVHNLVIRAGRNGVVEPSGRVVALSGVDVDIKAFPDQDYLFTRWKIIDGNARIADITSPETEISASSNTIIEALFEESPSLLRITESKLGKTEPSGEVYVQKDVPVTIRIFPYRGYTFKGWKTQSNVKIEEIDPFESSVALSVPEGTISPKFVKKSYKVTLEKCENGKVTPEGALTIYYGDTTRITATPDEGYRFIRWEIVSGHAKIDNMTKPKASVVCDSTGVTIKAIFADNAVEVSIVKHDLAEISPVGDFFVIRNSLLSVNARPKQGYMVSRWEVERGKANVEGRENALIKCKTPFEIKPVISSREYKLTILSDKNGTVVPSGTRVAVHKKPFPIVAIPNKGKHFIRWKLSSGWAEIENIQKDSTEVFLSKGNAVIQAEFAETICTLNVAATQGGYTEPVGKVNNYIGGDVIIQAVPNPKAAFVAWDIVEGKDHIAFFDTVTVAEQAVTSTKGSASIKAVFSTETVEMTVMTNGLGTTEPEGKFYAVKNKWNKITAVPNEDQRFVQWTTLSGGDDVQFKDPLSAETEVYPSAEDIVAKALFQSSTGEEDSPADATGQGDVTVKIVYDKTKGKIDTDETFTVRAGVPVVVTAIPHKDYYLDQWRTTKGEVEFSNKKEEKTTIVVKKGDAIITPIFLLKSVHTLEIRFKDYENRSKAIISKYR